MKLLIFILLFQFTLLCDTPKLFLLKTYTHDKNVSGWVMSEKLDGVRAYWNGKELISRSGKKFHAPKSFTQGFPSFELDGELWSKRGDFEKIVSIVNTQSNTNRWKELTYNIFEVPNQDGTLPERLSIIKTYLQKHTKTKIKIIKQIKINKVEEVQDFFEKVNDMQGEGIVIRNPSLPYYVGRKKDALKHKAFTDAECKIVELIQGKGKYQGLLGAIKCDYKGKIIKIGTGFSDQQRMTSFQVGTLITFKYYGVTRLENPKYPVFLRVRK